MWTARCEQGSSGWVRGVVGGVANLAIMPADANVCAVGTQLLSKACA